MRRSELTLETELHDLLGSGRNASIAARYYGFDGQGGASLRTVGNAIGLTRERVRQIVTATAESLRMRWSALTALDQIIAFVVHHMPAAAGAVEAELPLAGLTSSLFRLEGVIKAAGLLERRLPFAVTEVNGERLVHSPLIPSIDMIVHIARRVAAHWGITTLSDVAAKVRNVESCPADERLVASVLA